MKIKTSGFVIGLLLIILLFSNFILTAKELPLNTYFTGNVSNCVNSLPIANVLVSADAGSIHFEAETNNAGNYQLNVDPGTYQLTFYRLGYQEVVFNDVVIANQQTITQDVSMCVLANPVTNVIADPEFSCPGTYVTWNAPQGPFTIIYDDNSAEDFSIWTQSGGVVAVKFTPNSFPVTITGIKLFVGDGSFPQNADFLGKSIEIGVLDDDGAGGMPGTIIDRDTVLVQNYNWLHFEDVFNSVFNSGSFYIYYKQLQNSPDNPPTGIDSDLPIAYQSYSKIPGGQWMLSPYQDFMIRAELIGPAVSSKSLKSTGVLKSPMKPILMDSLYTSTTYEAVRPGFEKNGIVQIVNSSSRSLFNYNIFKISNFSPNDGEGPEDGIATAVGNTFALSHYDNTAKPPGFYAYAVEAVYDSGDKSEWTYSNIFSCGLDNIVDFNITACDGGNISGTKLNLKAYTFPYQEFETVCDSTGLIVFDSLINGYYNIKVVKSGYYALEYDSININNDTTINIELLENRYPARNLFVDSLSLKATWDAALVTALPLEDFEGEQFPPEGWWQSEDWGVHSFWTRINSVDDYPPQYDDSTSSWFAEGLNKDGFYDGSVDLITPAVDMGLSANLNLEFNRYFAGFYGARAKVLYSIDGGLQWNLIAELSPYSVWTPESLDLSPYNLTDYDSVIFNFNIEYYSNYEALCIDNVAIYGDTANVSYYNVYLDDSLVGSTSSDTLSFQFQDLIYGEEYIAGVQAHYSCDSSEIIHFPFVSKYLPPANDLNLLYTDNTDSLTLNWQSPYNLQPNPDDSTILDTVFADGLMHFNVYRNNEFLSSEEFTGQLNLNFIDNGLEPGNYSYYIRAVYDLSYYGYPGDTAESMSSDTLNADVVWGVQNPFFEDWSSGGFEQNMWQHEQNWSINSFEGNDKPSVMFSALPEMQNYSTALTSTWLNFSSIYEGDTFLDFDLQLADINQNSSEKLIVQIQASCDTNWTQITEYYNSSSKEFESKSLNISDFAECNVFRLRFIASGENSTNISSWMIDNISVHRECDAPQNFSAEYYWDNTNDYGVQLHWDAPELPMGPVWYSWSTGEDFTAIGGGNGQVSVGSKWNPENLYDLDGDEISRMSFFISDEGIENLKLVIWEGNTASDKVYEQQINNYNIGDFTIVYLDEKYVIDANQGFIIGLEGDWQIDYFPMGCDAGPAVAGYGDLISPEGDPWENLSDFGLDYNWNLAFGFGDEGGCGETSSKSQNLVKHSVINTKPSEINLIEKYADNIKKMNYSRNFNHFNLYWKQPDDEDYTLLEEIPYEEGVLSYQKKLPASVYFEDGKCYFFQMTAVWNDPTDECESVPGLSLNGVDDYVYTCVTDINDKIYNEVSIYPNPAKDMLTVNSAHEINSIKIINYLGVVVQEIYPNNKTKIVLNTSPLPNGAYLVQIDAINKTFNKKLYIAR